MSTPYKHFDVNNLGLLGFNISVPMELKYYFCQINPFDIFSRIGDLTDPYQNFLHFLECVFASESTLRPSREESIFRDNLLLEKDLPQIYTGKIETKVTVKGPFKTIRQQLPLTPFLWFPLHFIAFDKDVRATFQQCLQLGTPMPKLLNELILRTRQSRCYDSNITPSLDTTSIDNFYNVFAPQLKNTFLDYKYLRTQTGMLSYLNFIYLISSQSYYISVASDIIKSTPLTSGNHTTQMAINTVESNPFAATAMQGNSFKNCSPTEIHFLDAMFTRQRHIDTKGKYNISSLLPSIELQAVTIESISVYITKRCLGIVQNNLLLDDVIAPAVTPTTAPERPKRTHTPRKRKSLIPPGSNPMDHLQFSSFISTVLQRLDQLQAQVNKQTLALNP